MLFHYLFASIILTRNLLTCLSLLLCALPNSLLHPRCLLFSSGQFSRSVMSDSLKLFEHQAPLSITNSQSLPIPLSIVSVMPSNHLILHCPLLLLPPIFPSIRVFSNESALHIQWPKYSSFSFNISPSNEHPGLISFSMDWLDLLAVQRTLKRSPFSNITAQKHQFFCSQISL